MSFRRTTRPSLIGGILLILFSSGNVAQEPPTVRFTWLSNTTWVIEAGETTVLTDAAVSRLNVVPPNLERPETFFPDAIPPDIDLIEDIFEALAIDDVAHILVGHGHSDHVIDLGALANMTGSDIVGSRTVCLQAEALGVPAERCRAVEGGELLRLGPGLQVRVIRWEHSGDPSTPLGRLIEAPKELVAAPPWDPVSGAIGPSPFNGTPNGGGARAYLFAYEVGGDTLRWLVSDTGNADTFDGVPVTSVSFFDDLGLPLENLELVRAEGTPREWLIQALADEGTNEVDLWLAYGLAAHVRQVAGHLAPAALIPHHWGGFVAPYAIGVRGPPQRPALEAFLEANGITYLPQSQYLERYRLTPTGLERVPNAAAQRRLGLPVEP